MNYIFKNIVIDENRCQKKKPYEIWLVILPGIKAIVLS